MSTKKLEALLGLADAYADASFDQGLEKRTLDDAPENARSALETELRRQHAENETLRTGYDAARLEIASLQAQMEAVGAGGVEPLRKRCLHQISELAREPLNCAWTHCDDDSHWESACGEAWQFNDGDPAENNVRFCHGCGKPVGITAAQNGCQHGTE